MKKSTSTYFKVLFLTFLFASNAYAQSDRQFFDNNLKALLDLNFDKAAADAQKIINTKEKAYLYHYRLFLLKMINNDALTNYPDVFQSISNTLLNTQNNHDDSWAYLSEIYLQKGIIDYSNNNKWSALQSFIKAYNYWQKSELLHPRLIQNLKLKGVFNLLMGNLPDPYAQWAEWLGYKGDTNAGFEALEQYLTHTTYQKAYYQEAVLYLGFSFLKFTADEKQIKTFIIQQSTKPHPPLIQSILIRCAFKIRNPQLCKIWISNTQQSDFAPLQYLKGKYATFEFNSTAPSLFKHFLMDNNSYPFKADAHRYLSWHYFLNGDTTSYLKHQKRITSLQIYPTWEDQQANYESQFNELPNIYLLKSRIFFDRGDYETSQKHLLQYEHQIITNQALRIEYYYRLARCYHIQMQFQLAMKYYQKSINYAGDSKRYHGPYAAIFAAQIMADKKQKEKAKYYLQQARRLNNGEHKNSVQHKISLINKQISQL